MIKIGDDDGKSTTYDEDRMPQANPLNSLVLVAWWREEANPGGMIIIITVTAHRVPGGPSRNSTSRSGYCCGTTGNGRWNGPEINLVKAASHRIAHGRCVMMV
jgi:hypothetical protein